MAAHAAAVAAANEKIAEIQAKRAEIEAARAAAEEAAKAAAEAAAEAAAAAAEAGEEGGEEGGDGGDGEGKGDDGEGEGKAGEDFDKQLAELEAEPEVPPYPTIASRDVDLVFCLDTLGKGRSYTAADVDTARAWCNAVGAALAALELAAVKEDWDEAKAQEQGNAKAVEEDEAEAEGAAKGKSDEQLCVCGSLWSADAALSLCKQLWRRSWLALGRTWRTTRRPTPRPSFAWQQRTRRC